MGTIVNQLLTAIIAFVQFGPVPVGEQAPLAEAPAVEMPVLEPSPARIELVDMPDELVDSVIWAIGLFERADLTLPPLRFVHHGDDRDQCRGHSGTHRATPQRSVIGLCTTEPGPLTDAVILHEVSHAWLDHDLSEAREADFRALRGYEHWRNHEVARWYENGCEQAAAILVWGLIDRPIGVVTIDDHSCEDLDEGYRALTGAAPLHGYRDHC